MQILNDEALIKTWQARVGKPNRANRYIVSIGAEILATQMQILDLAGEIHRAMFGAVPEWLVNGLLKLKAEREGFNSLTTE